MLEFVRELFVRLAPNVTAWCSALEAFLWRRQYKLEHQDSLRQRFGKALQWYIVLVNEAAAKVQREWDGCKHAVLQDRGNSRWLVIACDWVLWIAPASSVVVGHDSICILGWLFTDRFRSLLSGIFPFASAVALVPAITALISAITAVVPACYDEA
ncbi:hypothetical protein EUX98_g9339 [Antrodiella citrinella]|uniref:Uncharacterized protein n=1 Tax=Antrodiella citrinella TaxID=2447956 RepID=A0A4V3XF60_9APHY|nr:hypothetical protein EUX98_g9339 [Antrodiella citrinella]